MGGGFRSSVFQLRSGSAEPTRKRRGVEYALRLAPPRRLPFGWRWGLGRRCVRLLRAGYGMSAASPTAA
jgi:hypothetical protein